MECEHDLKELSKGFRGTSGYSPTLLKCKSCKKVFFMNPRTDKVQKIEIED